MNVNEMKAAYLDEVGQPLTVRNGPRPKPTGDEVLVRVKATAALPHQQLVISGNGPFLLPELPAIIGWDAVGVVEKVGPRAYGVAPGDRVYVHPIISCGTCDNCQRGAPLVCERYMLLGGFGLSPGSIELQKIHVSGGFAGWLTAPARNLVPLPANLSDEVAVRIGFAGVAYRSLKRGEAGPGKSVLIHGATGNLGVLAVDLAVAMGADKVIAVARRAERLERMLSHTSDRVQAIVVNPDVSFSEQVHELTAGRGVDVLIDYLDGATGAAAASVSAGLATLAPEGVAVLTGAIFEPVAIDYMALVAKDRRIVGSHGFTMSDARELMAMINSGAYRFPQFENRVFPLEQVNQALALAWSRPGGFVNVVVQP